jgi:hypothetical protein
MLFSCEGRTMTNQHLTVWQHVTAEFSGRPLSGSYAIEDGMVKFRRLELLRDVGIYFIRKDLKWVRGT